MEEDNILAERKKKVFGYLKNHQGWIIWLVLAFIAGLGYYIRTRNLKYLIDVTTGKYIPLALDPFVFLRYAKYVLENGQLMAVDAMRYVPWGYNTLSEFSFLSHFIVYLYKFLHFFNPAVTLEYADVIYPPVMFVVGLIMFFILVRKVFNWKVALIASGFLAVVPAYLYRTMAGFSDKEALAMFFLFLCLYLFVMMIEEKRLKFKMLYSLLSAVSMGLMGAVWGGVNSLFLVIGGYILIELFFGRFKQNDFFAYLVFFIFGFLTLYLVYPARYNLTNLVSSLTSLVMFVALAVALVNYLLFQLDILKIKNRLKTKIPLEVVSFIVVAVIGVLGVAVVLGPGYIFSRISDIFINLTEPFGTSRWALTVAESHQPYFTDWVGQFSWKGIILFIAGAVLLFYNLFNRLKYRYYLTGGFFVFLLLFLMSRYSAGSVFNGETNLSLVVYVGSIMLFGLGFVYFYFYTFYKDKEEFNLMNKLDGKGFLILLAFLIMAIGARSAIRLFFLFTPFAMIFVGYAFVTFYEKVYLFKEEAYKYTAIVLVILLAGFIFYGYYNSSFVQASNTGPSYNTQWQYGMEWVRGNTPEDAVLGHWWDYGYWVQTGGERATMSDGGNVIGSINHYTGRHLMTGQSDLEALEYLASHNVTHVLMVSDEIGKYGAFSSIGADENYDRYSWIPTMSLDLTQTQETRNGTTYVYTGGAALDDDFIYGDTLFPAYSSAVVGITLPMLQDENGSVTEILQPTAVLYYGGKYQSVPMACVAINDEEIVFEGEDALQSCLYIIPVVKGQNVNDIGAGLYLSKDVWASRFAQWYLLGNEGEYINLVYDDSTTGFPLMYYNGGLYGPMKIWEITYPDDLVIPEEYFSTEMPEGVTEVMD